VDLSQQPVFSVAAAECPSTGKKNKISGNKFRTNPIQKTATLDTHSTDVAGTHYLDLSLLSFSNSFVHQHTMPQQFSRQNHVYNLPTGYRFAMASVVDDAKKKGQEAK
jgi:hypothetical protein